MRVWIRQTIRTILIVSIGILSLSCGSFGKKSAGSVTPFVVYPIEKLRSGETYERSVSVTVRAAGNEREPVVLGVVNDSPGEVRITGVTIHQDGPRSVGAVLYRVIPYTVTTRTSLFPGKDVGKGDWSDALVPIEFADTVEPDPMESDPIRSPRTAPELSAVFTPPIGISPGDTVSFLLELYLPAAVQRISEDLRVDLFTESGRTFTYTVRIEPYPFTLPSRSSLKTAFGFSWSAVAATHKKLSDASVDSRELHLEYLRLLAEHRISVFSPQYEPVKVARGEDGVLTVDWSAFDSVTGRLLDGTLFPGVPPATSFRFPPAQEGAEESDLPEYYRLAAAHLAERGWFDRAFYYLRDEPLRREYPTVRASAEAIKAAAPGVRTLATETFSRALAGYVDIWCPDTPNLGDSIPFIPLVFRDFKLYPDWQYNPDPSVYRGRKGKGEEYWFYNCMSARFWNYPNMFIDYPAAYQRVLPWLAYLYGMEGFLYWDTVYSMKQKKNPWNDQYQFMSNGDGNLLYPGVPGLHGLTRHTPVPSLRMVLLREGFEDFEYLKMLEQKAGYREARNLAGKIIWRSMDFETDMRKFHTVRNDIAEAISSVPDPAAVP